MSFPNMQLRALVESLVAYASAKGWSVREVESTFDSLMEPMRKREAQRELEAYAERLTYIDAYEALTYAMTDYWDQEKMDRLFAALALRFPKRAKTIENIDQWAGDASNENHEKRPDEAYVARMYNKALNALKRLPWPEPVQVDPIQG